MRAEIFFKNGKKVTVDDVVNIDRRNGDVILEFESRIFLNKTIKDIIMVIKSSLRKVFEENKIDMIKLVGFE